MSNTHDFVVVGGNGNHDLDKSVIKSVNEIRVEHPPLEFLHLDIDRFVDGEPDLRIQDHNQIENRHAILFQSIQTVKLMEETLILAWGIKKHYGAQSLTAVINFCRFRRLDHPEKVHEIPASFMMIDMLIACGVDRIFFCEIHSQKTLEYCKTRKIEAYNISSAPVFAAKLRPIVEEAEAADRPFRVHAPDLSAIPRSILLAKELGVGVSATPKRRDHDGQIEIIKDSGELRAIQEKLPMEVVLASKELKGSYVCIFDDELASGSTAVKAGRNLLSCKVKRVLYAGCHPVCVPGWKRKFVDSGVFQPGDMHLADSLDCEDYEFKTAGKVVRSHLGPLIARDVHDNFISNAGS